jgi:ubiquinone/menaquinone biosynthesis C-methylase UbiE
MLDALALPRGMAVLDAGCGTGALADALALRDPMARITGIDISPAFLDAARARVPSGDFRQGDLCALDLHGGVFDAALSLLVLQFVPDRAKAVAEMLRVTRPGGLVAAAMWDFCGRFFVSARLRR